MSGLAQRPTATIINATPNPTVTSGIPAGGAWLADNKNRALSPPPLEYGHFLPSRAGQVPWVPNSTRDPFGSCSWHELPGGVQPISAASAFGEKPASVGTVGEPSPLVQNSRTTEPAQSCHLSPSRNLPQPPRDVTWIFFFCSMFVALGRLCLCYALLSTVIWIDLMTANDLTVTSTPSKTLPPVLVPLLGPLGLKEYVVVCTRKSRYPGSYHDRLGRISVRSDRLICRTFPRKLYQSPALVIPMVIGVQVGKTVFARRHTTCECYMGTQSRFAYSVLPLFASY